MPSPVFPFVSTSFFFDHTLNFEYAPQMHPASNAIMNLSTKTPPTFSQKQLIAIAAIRLGCRSHNANKQRAINQVRRQVHCVHGLSKPGA